MLGGVVKVPQVKAAVIVLAPQRCVVTNESAIFAARSMVRPYATQLGFEREVVEELVIVVSELTSNILKYGKRGYIELSQVVREEGTRGIAIVAADETPPFDLAVSLVDGCDSKGKLDPARVFGRAGIGAGLGAVARLSDALEQVPTATGKQMVVRRFLGRPRRGSSPGF
jgi:anti-sigma regulatory factor (Ser/Thr protein kinase)